MNYYFWRSWRRRGQRGDEYTDPPPSMLYARVNDIGGMNHNLEDSAVKAMSQTDEAQVVAIYKLIGIEKRTLIAQGV